MRVIDFHCDTPLRLFRGVAPSDCMAATPQTNALVPYAQLSACFCPATLEDEEGYRAVCDMLQGYRRHLSAQNNALTITTAPALRQAMEQGKHAYLFTLEDARVLCGDISRVTALFALGVRLITPLWRDITYMGGAWNTDVGLSDFGKEALSAFLFLGGLVDLSHASRAAHRDIVALCRAVKRAPLATHSNAFSLAPHRRNLTDAQIREIGTLGGVVGINLYPPFLSEHSATYEVILHHLRHIVRVGGEEIAVLGSDFDGIDQTPEGLGCASELPRLAEYMQKNGFTARQIDGFFYQNGYQYLMKNLPQG